MILITQAAMFSPSGLTRHGTVVTVRITVLAAPERLSARFRRQSV